MNGQVAFHRSIIGEEEIEAVTATLTSGWLTTGPKVAKFEADFAHYAGAEYAVGVTSCTEALFLSLVALGIGPGKEVITTPVTWCSTANVIEMVGATPVFVDIDPKTRNIDTTKIEAAMSPQTRAIIPVHYAGQPCHMDEIEALASNADLRIVNDCAHALEANYQGRSLGTYGDTCCYSFYPIKNITTAEGGMICTDDEELAKELRVLRLHGLSLDAYQRYSGGYKHFEVVRLGYKCNMSDLQAAIGLCQLRRVDQWWERRREIVARYDAAFGSLPTITALVVEEHVKSALHLYPVLVPERDRVMEQLKTRGVGTGVHFTALHLHKYYREKYGYHTGQLPVAESVGAHTLSLPLYPAMSDEDVAYVIEQIQGVLLT